MAELTKTEVVLGLDRGLDGPQDWRSFGDATPDDPSDHVGLIIQTEAWVEMGRPEKVTVTIEPGDRLNDE
jgi:hypothetical protein